MLDITARTAEVELHKVMLNSGPGMDTMSSAVCAAVAARMVEAAAIFGRKQRAYGCGNVVDIGGQGVIGRAREKLRRIVNIVDGGSPDGGEPVRVEALDVLNLAAILCLVLDGAWPHAEWKPGDDL
jgi:hypothetical protein